ncbi:MAG: CHAT domain-containing protein [Gemmatimonadota bacterium]
MSALVLLLAGVGFAALPQDASRTAALMELARSGSHESLVDEVRRSPDAAREALQELLHRSVESAESGARPGRWEAATGPTRHAEALARAYEAAWGDPFLKEEVDRFLSWSLEERRDRVSADRLRAEGNEAYRSVGLSQAMELWRRSLRYSERLGDPSGAARTLGNLGGGFYAAGEPDSARFHLEEARNRAMNAGDLRTAAGALTNLANLAYDEGDLERAADLYGRSVAMLSRVGERRHLSTALHNAALVHLELGDFPRAREALERSLELSRSHGYPEDEAEALTTLADVAQAEGAYREAETLLGRALALSRETGSVDTEAAVHHSMGLLDLARGDYREAVERLGAARASYTQLGRLPDAVFVLADRARARAAAGDLEGGLADLRAADGLADSLVLGNVYLTELAMTRADLNLALGAYPAALAEFRRAAALSTDANDLVGQAEALEGEGYLFLVRGDFPEAERLLEDALQLRSRPTAHSPRASALIRLYMAAAQEEMGQVDAARQTLQRAEQDLAALGDSVGEAAVLATRGDLEARAGASRGADSLFEKGLRTLGGRPAPQVEWSLRLDRARMLHETGRQQEAVAELRTAVAVIEASAVGLPLDRRVGFQPDWADAHQLLAEVLLELGDLEGAFEANERARTQRSLAATLGARIDSLPGVPKELLERRQDLAQRIADLTRRLRWGDASRPGLREAPWSLALSLSDARSALAESQVEYAELLSEMSRRSTRPSHLVDPSPPPIRRVSSLLSRGQSLIEYAIGEGHATAFVITADTAVAIDLDVTRETLGDLVDFARGVIAQTAGSRSASDEPREIWALPLRRLYETLVSPVEETGLVREGSSLVLVPHRELHYLPFQALLDPRTGTFLVERYAISYAPSAGAWVRLSESTGMMAPDAMRDRAAAAAGGQAPRVLAMAPRPDTLPGSRYEVEAIGRLFPGRATVLVGDRASERALRDAARRFDIIHLATFGVLNKSNPLFSFVEMAGAGNDVGYLEAHEIFGLGLQARLLTLSACETGVGSGGLWDVPPGDDWTSLAGAFLEAGARSVLASLWQVEDLATAELMQRFYRHLVAGMGMNRALAEAQRELLSNPDTAHPFYWAAFQLLGLGSGGVT